MLWKPYLSLKESHLEELSPRRTRATAEDITGLESQIKDLSTFMGVCVSMLVCVYACIVRGLSTRSWSGVSALEACKSWCQQLDRKVQSSYWTDHMHKSRCWWIQVVLLYVYLTLRDLHSDQAEKRTGWFLLVLFSSVGALSICFDLYGQLCVYVYCGYV